MADLPSGTVTFLFTDIEGSTRVWQEHPEAMRGVLARHDDLIRSAIEVRNGYVVKTTGDGFHAAFADPVAAIGAAVDAQRWLIGEPWALPEPLRVRMGVHTGSVESRDGDYYGTAVNKAARLMSVAHGGQIVVSQATEVLVRDSALVFRDLGEHRLRDLSRAERVFQVLDAGLPAEFPPLRSLDVYPENLPLQVSSFVGRDDEQAKLAAALENSRLVTVVGVGGVGKTRLAIQVAANTIGRFNDGAWFCELAAADDGDAMCEVVAAAIGVQSRPGVRLERSIVEGLQARRVLVILDNCEHLVREASELVSAILRECPAVTVLATSREALGVSGEQVWPLGSLGIPDRADLQAAMTNASVRLFTDRAVAARPGFDVGPTNVEAVVEICRRLDGIPLAIELAAARVAALSVADIRGLLDERFRLLAGGRRSTVDRHQTLRATVDWSYSLLTGTERSVFDRLGVFVGSFDVRAVQAVCCDEQVGDWDVLEALSSLVGKSMLGAEELADGSMRYQLLETLRQYARERLDEAGDIDRWRRNHAQHYARVVEEELAAMMGPDEFLWRPRFFADFDNIRGALTWSLDSDDPADLDYGTRIVATIAESPEPYLAYSDWAERIVPLVEDRPGDLRDTVLAAASVSLAQFGDYESAEQLAQQALERGSPAGRMAYGALAMIALHRGDREEAYRMSTARLELDDSKVSEVSRIGNRSIAATFAAVAGDREAAERYTEEGLRLALALRNPSALALMYYGAGLGTETRDPDQALLYFEESAAITRQGGVHVGLGTNLGHIARLRDKRGETDLALAALDEGLEYFRRVGPWPEMTVVFAQMCRTLARLGRSEPAATIAGIVSAGALAAYGAAGTEARIARATDEVRAELGDETYASRFARGAEMTYSEAMQFARDQITAARASSDD